MRNIEARITKLEQSGGAGGFAYVAYETGTGNVPEHDASGLEIGRYRVLNHAPMTTAEYRAAISGGELAQYRNATAIPVEPRDAY